MSGTKYSVPYFAYKVQAVMDGRDIKEFHRDNPHKAVALVLEATLEYHEENCSSDHEGDWNECRGTGYNFVEAVGEDYTDCMRMDYNEAKALRVVQPTDEK